MNLKSLLFCAVLCAAITSSAFANNRPAPNVKTVINEFAESILDTDTDKLSRIMSSDALLKFTQGDGVQTQSQSSILKHMKLNKGSLQNCSARVEVLASSNAMVMAKVDFIYQDFIVENYLCLELDRNDNWKITRINKFFTEKSQANILSLKN